MNDSNPSTAWEVVVATVHDPGDPGDRAEEGVVACSSEPEARRVYADTVAEAAARGYEYVKLRSRGRDVESWPQLTGWTS